MSKAVFTFGRANPPTNGHEKLIKKVHDVAKKKGAEPRVYLSQSQDKKKNPLSYKDKVNFMKRAIPKYAKSIQMDTSVKTIIDVMKKLDGKYEEVTLVVGSDRVDSFNKLLNQYNEREYNFESIDVVSAGERDPDQEGVSGISASKMREAAKEGDFDIFKSGLPSYAQRNDKLANEIYMEVRKGMQIRECEEDDSQFIEELQRFIDNMNDDDLEESLPADMLQRDQLMRESYNRYLERNLSLLEEESMFRRIQRKAHATTKALNKSLNENDFYGSISERADYIVDKMFVEMSHEDIDKYRDELIPIKESVSDRLADLAKQRITE